MNARHIAEEVSGWYHSQLDPWVPHATNVKRHLHGPVLSLTHSILTSTQNESFHSEKENSPTAQEEKKCCDTTTPSGLVDKSSWNLKAGRRELLESQLERRHRARLDAFLTGVEIAIPSEVTPTTSPSGSMESIPQALTPVGSPVLTSLNHHGKALLRSVSVESSRQKQPQIRHRELRIRLELYLRSLYRVRALQQDCVLPQEPDRAIQARAERIVAAFVSTVGCVRSMGPTLVKLLANLSKELLAVEFIDETLYRVIRRIVNEYEHGTSFASLAFLSSPEASACSRLTPLVLQYIRYLQSDCKIHEQACELERMLSVSLDYQMRRYLKTVEFQSIGHLLEVCQGFRTELTTIELPSSNHHCSHSRDLCHNPEAVRQAIRDLQREVITINGHVLPPVTSRADLIHLLSQSLNSRTLTAAKKTTRPLQDAFPEISRVGSCPSFISTEPATSQEESLDNESLSETNPPARRHSRHNRRASFHLATVDLLTRRLLIAASRTGTGGDAYFIVRDLFGDDDVEVVPAKAHHIPHHVRATRVGSIEIQVRLASVTIKCHGSFDIYPRSQIGTCEPLIQLHTTSSETIYLQELRSCDSSSEGNNCLDDGSRSSDGDHMVLQERKTNKTGRRILSIRPALYEKVQVWNTPS